MPSFEIKMRAGSLTIVYTFGEPAPQSSDPLSEGVARQSQARGEFLSVFDFLAVAEPVIGDDQFALSRIELIQTLLQTLVSDLGYNKLAGSDHQIVRSGLGGRRRVIF